MNKCIDGVLIPLVARMSSTQFIEMQDEPLLHLETGV